ncbi:MAG: hypothetical protein AAFV77_08305, partial [Planctomycetota bacterium]
RASTEGFDVPAASVFVNCRPTKSRALYVQMAGRVMRPLEDVVDGVEDRLGAIAESDKPSCYAIDFTGVSTKHSLMSPVDILGGDRDPEVRDKAKKIAEDKPGIDAEEALELAEEEVAAARRQEQERQEKAQRARQSVTARAQYRKYTVDAFNLLGMDAPGPDLSMDLQLQANTLTAHERGALTRAKIDPGNMSPDAGKTLAKKLIEREAKGLCTYPQLKMLKLKGIDGTDMTKDAAGRIMGILAQNNWRLPRGLKL